MNLFSLLKNCFEHLRIKLSRQYQPAQTPKSRQKQKTLVLDLDETLVHCEFKENCNFRHETLLQVVHKGQEYKVYLKTRPYLEQFLIEASKEYEIVIFTAGYEAYCERVLSYIDRHRVISDYLARGSCQFINGVCFKDLQLLDRPMESLIFIDNNPNAFDKCKENGLLIPSFLDSDDDDCLLRLIPFLKYLSKKREFRPVEQNLQQFEFQFGQTLFSEIQQAIGIVQEEPDDDTLSEGKVVKQDMNELTELDIKHKKTSTHLEAVCKINNKIRSATVFSG